MKTAPALLSGLFLSLASHSIAHQDDHALYNFIPESSPILWNDNIPALYTFKDTQVGSSSWWSSSFLTGVNGKQYVALAHVLNVNTLIYYRGSTLDLQSGNYQQFITLGSAADSAPRLEIVIDENRFESVADDNISTLRARAVGPNVDFDLVWDSASLIIANGGTGGFVFGPGVTYQWSVPSSPTRGTIAIAGETIHVDPARSLTWYDRQWGSTNEPPTGNWTWFELHVPETEYKFSVWVIDNPATDQASRFATIRDGAGAHSVVPVVWSPHYARTYASEASGRLYPLDWTVTVTGFGTFRVSSPVADQEMVGQGPLSTAYEGFVTFNGTLQSRAVTGYGIVEMVYGS
ncbi:Kievitone hydratase [Aspergillus pseudoustus]|uniref:Kievitone hydratase n=1 Tax=Aspergillus pseudoustus TaxID=1810923 RepID=A0ABR4K9G6_9EURO